MLNSLIKMLGGLQGETWPLFLLLSGGCLQSLISWSHLSLPSLHTVFCLCSCVIFLCLSLKRTFVMGFRTLLENPGQSSYLKKMLNLITFSRLFPPKENIYKFQALGFDIFGLLLLNPPHY